MLALFLNLLSINNTGGPSSPLSALFLLHFRFSLFFHFPVVFLVPLLWLKLIAYRIWLVLCINYTLRRGNLYKSIPRYLLTGRGNRRRCQISSRDLIFMYATVSLHI